MSYFRYGHVDNVKVKVGDKVKKWQQIADNGTGNGQWSAHCHFDILTYKPDAWTNFVIGQTKQWVKDHYADPTGLEKVVLPTFDHYGYKWLEYADYSGGKAYHSGIDLNGKGGGNSDLGDPIHSACDGKVVYVYSGTGKNSGWGDMVVIEETKDTTDWKKKYEEAQEIIEETRNECARLQKQLDDFDVSRLRELIPMQADITTLEKQLDEKNLQLRTCDENNLSLVGKALELEKTITQLKGEVERLNNLQGLNVEKTTIGQAVKFLLEVALKK